MSVRPFQGVIPPVLTPLTDNRQLDVASFERLVNRLIDNGVDGLFVLGSTGGVVFATAQERERILAEAVRIAAGRVPVLAGVIDTQTAPVLQHIKAAEQVGVDAVVATAPFYAITARDTVRRHFEIIGERSNVPVFAYDIPVCVHTKLDPDLLVDLGLRGAITGVKDSSGDDVSFRRLALKNSDAGEPLTLLTGHEFCVDGAYLAGAHGSVPGLGNVDPAGFVALDQAAKVGDWEGARRIQDRLARLMEICLAPVSAQGWGAGVGAFRTALWSMGVIDSNQQPEPFDALDERDLHTIRQILEEVGPRA
ncbi:dihydrodipicolinate synthase family protein [Micropruina sonneratiae]|uniref:dihydrodipicolinate synthase family protein n=1 Tax=Micropruina sonneratiae TaxID=2986940 RepID=UPI00222686D3|nr:dihydrodipicolinate synthase family protein [Micropruina sp. KQZ13P-5]MCW3156964.1 dihydrodipicolinate synthase family protein [Micropruina sp. KQZ13P-5]